MKAVCRTLVVACAAVVGLPCAGVAQYVAIAPPQHAIYPADGQSAEQQQTDMTECQVGDGLDEIGMHAGDFDDDGTPDFATSDGASSSTYTIYLND